MHAISLGHWRAPLWLGLEPGRMLALPLGLQWSFIHLNEPLLNEPAQAWQYGPVVLSLYHAIKQFGAQPVGFPIAGDADPQELSAQAQSLIAAVYRAYGHLSGVQLSNMTHQPHTPWSDAWNNAGKNAVISNSNIAEHYRALNEH